MGYPTWDVLYYMGRFRPHGHSHGTSQMVSVMASLTMGYNVSHIGHLISINGSYGTPGGMCHGMIYGLLIIMGVTY